MTDTPVQFDGVPAWLATVVVAVASGIAGVLASYGAVGFTPGFVVAPVEGALSRLMPAQLVTFAITVLGDLGQKLNLAMAGVLVVLLYASLVVLALTAGRDQRSRGLSVLASAVLSWVATVVLTFDLESGVWVAAAVALVVAVSEFSIPARAFPESLTSDGNGRRRVVSAVGTAAVAAAVGATVGRSQGPRGTVSPPDEGSVADGELMYDVEDRIHEGLARSFDVGEMDTAVSQSFFNVSIGSVDPQVSRASWSLSVTGAVEESFELTFPDLEAMDHEHRFVTLRCVGENLNGHKMDTALWTGVPVASLIDRASPSSDCDCVMLHGEDNYSVQFPIAALRPGMLAYGMNGRKLPRSHGAPVRALVPGHWGEVNTKWISEIEFLEEEADGYWEQRGWHGTGPVKTVAKLHGREARPDGQIAIGGHTYAGTRGISAVEVSTDGGDSWTEAELTERLPGPSGPAADVGGGGDEYAADAWRSWRHVYDDPGEEHEVVVRARERDGTLQPEEETGSFPSGPSGWVSDTVRPETL